MAKSLTIKNRNDEILYPKTVSALVFNSATGDTVEEEIQQMQLNVNTKENVGNKITTLSDQATDTQYPSAKSVYDRVIELAPKNNPVFTGIPLAPTAQSGTNTTQIATTEFVNLSLGNTLGNLQYFQSSNFGGFSISDTESSAVSNISSIFTNKGYTVGTTYWFLAGTDLETLKAYEYSGTGSPTLITAAVYNFKDVNGVVEYVNERFRLLAMLLWHLVYTDNVGSSMAQQLYQLIQDGIENGLPVIANLSRIEATYVGGTKYIGAGLQPSDFTVVAYFSDSTSQVVNAFAINPSVLTDTTNTITISYGGKTTNVTVPAEEVPQGGDVTLEVLGSSMGTVLYQNGVCVGYTPIASQAGNGIDITISQALTTLYGRQGDYGAYMDGWILNGTLIPSEIVSETINLGGTTTYTATTKATFMPQNGLLYPRLKGNLTLFKSVTVNDDTLGTTKTDSNYYRTNIFPMDADQSLWFRFPGVNLADTPSDSNGHYINMFIKIWNGSGSSCLANSSNTTRLYRTIRVQEDSDGVLYCPSHGIASAGSLTNNPNVKRILVSFEPRTGDSGNSAVYQFTESQVRKIEVGYAGTEWLGCPPFKIDEIVSFGSNITWSTTGSRNCPRSNVYYNGYVVTIGDELRDVIVTDVQAKTKVTLHPHTYTSEWANFRGSTAGFLSFKYNENDFYPLLVTAWGYSAAGTSPYISVLRLNGTSATSFTIDEVCRWTTSDSYAYIAIDKQDNLYLISKDKTAGTNGVYFIKTITSADLVNQTLATTGDRLSYLYGHSNICDVTFASDNGQPDLLVSCVNRSGVNFPLNMLTIEKLGTTSTNDAKIVQALPLNNRFIDEWLRGVCYAGNGVYYLSLVSADAVSGSNHSGRLVKLTIPRPIFS